MLCVPNASTFQVPGLPRLAAPRCLRAPRFLRWPPPSLVPRTTHTSLCTRSAQVPCASGSSGGHRSVDPLRGWSLYGGCLKLARKVRRNGIRAVNCSGGEAPLLAHPAERQRQVWAKHVQGAIKALADSSSRTPLLDPRERLQKDGAKVIGEPESCLNIRLSALRACINTEIETYKAPNFASATNVLIVNSG